MNEFAPNGFPYGHSMLFPAKRELEEKREDEKRFEEEGDEEKRAWTDFILGHKKPEDRKREFEKRHLVRHSSMMDRIEQALLRHYVPAQYWKRADSQGNARNGLSLIHGICFLIYDFLYATSTVFSRGLQKIRALPHPIYEWSKRRRTRVLKIHFGTKIKG